ncbi:hypothetical protein [Morganella phage Mecenats66]|nr:hypothetical protein [Morganella phage Mecenats66]
MSTKKTKIIAFNWNKLENWICNDKLTIAISVDGWLSESKGRRSEAATSIMNSVERSAKYFGFEIAAAEKTDSLDLMPDLNMIKVDLIRSNNSLVLNNLYPDFGIDLFSSIGTELTIDCPLFREFPKMNARTMLFSLKCSNIEAHDIFTAAFTETVCSDKYSDGVRIYPDCSIQEAGKSINFVLSKEIPSPYLNRLSRFSVLMYED